MKTVVRDLFSCRIIDQGEDDSNNLLKFGTQGAYGLP